MRFLLLSALLSATTVRGEVGIFDADAMAAMMAGNVRGSAVIKLDPASSTDSAKLDPFWESKKSGNPLPPHPLRPLFAHAPHPTRTHS